MRLKSLLGLIFLLFSLPANAQGTMHFWTGNDLLERLNGNVVEQIEAKRYVAGVSDTLASLLALGTLPRQICTAPGMTDQQIADVAKQWLVNHPEARHAVAASLVYAAMLKAFPCGK